MSIANAVTLKPVRSVSTSVIKDDSVIVFSFSGGALPSGVTYSGPTNLYVPQSDGSYELVTSGPLFSDEALYIPAGFSDRNGNKTFAGLTAGVIGSGGVMPTGHSVASSDGSFPLTVEVLGSGTDSDGLPYYDVAIDGTNSAGSTQYATLYLNTAKSASASDPVTWGCWVKDLDALSHGYMMQVVVTGDTELARQLSDDSMDEPRLKPAFVPSCWPVETPKQPTALPWNGPVDSSGRPYLGSGYITNIGESIVTKWCRDTADFAVRSGGSSNVQ